MGRGAWWAAVHGVMKSDTTERPHFQFSLSCTGEGNGNPVQCSFLENPRDWGAWLAAVYGVAQSWIRLKQLSSSNAPTSPCYTILILLMMAPCIINCLTSFVFAQVNKLQHAVLVQQRYKTMADHGICHSPLDGHCYKDYGA